MIGWLSPALDIVTAPGMRLRLAWLGAFAVLAGLAAGPLAGLAALLGGAVALWPVSAGPVETPDEVVPEERSPEPDDALTAVVSVEASWRRILEALPDPAIVVDGERLVMHANEAAQTLFPAIEVGRSVALASRQPQLGEAIDEVLETGRRRSVMLHERVPVARRLAVGVARFPVDSGGREGVLLVMHDISEGERLAEMRADFIAHASHELRTPLAGIRGFIETLQGPARNDLAARERFLGIMSSEAMRMTRLLDDLLSLSRLEMRAHIAPTDRIDLTQTVDEALASLRSVVEAAGATLHARLADGPRHVRGDADELAQVLDNLVQNAVKYGREGGHITVEMTDERAAGRPMVCIRVIDDGPGIEPRHIPRLTERFYRVDDRTSRARGGTGLGLAIVKHILARHGGELRIASEVGKGSTFSVLLPSTS